MHISQFRKRGSAAAAMQTGFVLIGLLLALVVSGSFIKKTADDVSGTTFEKNYIAREIALGLDAVYASPAKVEYSYSLRQYSFTVELVDSRVVVKDSLCDLDGDSGFYDYFDGLGDDPNRERLYHRITPYIPGPTTITFTKDVNGLSISARNGNVERYGENPCRKSVQ